jgi:cell wall-associated NlpC family hydrolase
VNERVQQILNAAAARNADKRMDVFQVEAFAGPGGSVRLAGRVLESAQLADLRRDLTSAGYTVEDADVRVLRSATATLLTVATNLTDLHTGPSFLDELLTQILNGQPLELLEERDKWCYVRQLDGYLGWAYKPYLAPYVEQTPTHWIASPSAPLFATPHDDGPPLTLLLAGTAVTIDNVNSDWAEVRPAGGMLPVGWISQAHLRPMCTLPAADARAQIVADAKRLTGVYYLWGGASPFGLDCSALAQLTHRLSGYTLPRDAYMQFASPAAKVVEPPFQPGDLLFFHGETNKHRITHVGISIGGWDMIHASRARNGVYVDHVQSADHLRTTFAGARAFVDR